MISEKANEEEFKGGLTVVCMYIEARNAMMPIDTPLEYRTTDFGSARPKRAEPFGEVIVLNLCSRRKTNTSLSAVYSMSRWGPNDNYYKKQE